MMISFKNRLVFTCLPKSIRDIYLKNFRTVGSVSTWNDGDASFPEEPVVQSVDHDHTDNNQIDKNYSDNNQIDKNYSDNNQIDKNYSDNNQIDKNHTDNNCPVNHELDRVLPRTNEEFYDLKKLPNVSPCDSRSLTVAIIGMPNAGKSTLVNQLVGTRICSVSKRVHTTRRNIVGIMQEHSTQIVFLDTPGLVTSGHCHKHSLEQTFLSHPVQGSRIADLILVVVDASNKRERERLNEGILDQVRKHSEKTSALVINKVDAIGSKRRLIDISTRLSEGHIDGKPLPHVQIEDHLTPPTAVQEHRRLDNIERRVRRKGHIVDIENIVNTEGEPEVDRIGWKNFDRVFMVSALDGDGVDGLRDYLVSRAVPRPWTYHPSLITPLPPSQIVYNAVREKLLEYLPQEIPYMMSLQIQAWDVTRSGTITICVDLLAPKSRYMAIILGPRGQTIRMIASQLRTTLSDAFKCDVVIKLNLKDRDKKSLTRKKDRR